jgi:hypothetical protein
MGDWFHCLAPQKVPLKSGGGLVEYPVAVAPLLRLPYQAGIVLRLGPAYGAIQTGLWNTTGRGLPVTLLFHGADLTDFSSTGHPFFTMSPFFAMPMDKRLGRARRLLEGILRGRHVALTEDSFNEFGSESVHQS